MFIKVLPSAKKHGLNDLNIRIALQNCVCQRLKKNEKGNCVSLAIGILQSGQTVELMYYINNFEQIVVFHAMSPACNSFINEIKKKRG